MGGTGNVSGIDETRPFPYSCTRVFSVMFSEIAITRLNSCPAFVVVEVRERILLVQRVLIPLSVFILKEPFLRVLDEASQKNSFV